MQELTPDSILEVWEQGVSLPVGQKALTLLSAAFPQETPDSLAQRSIGQRNTLLLTLRERLFGARFVAAANCPECGERSELNFEAADIRAEHSLEPSQPLSVEACGYRAFFRLPNCSDLADCEGFQDAADIERKLLERCLLSARHGGEEALPEALPTEVVERIVEAMEEADPQANIHLSVQCPACRHQWSATLDILSYIWSELDSWARRVLQEVHALASAYGWSEREILRMRPRRRQIYLEMIGR